MKTLADLKRTAHLYEWSLVHNSWFKDVPSFQREFRRVTKLQSKSFAIGIVKNGELLDSWQDFPKSSELRIEHNGDLITLTITRDCGDRPAHVMQYILRPIK